MDATTPSDALAALRAASRSGVLDDLCERHRLTLLVAFGSAVTGPMPDRAKDLDVAVHSDEDVDVIGVLADLTDLTGLDAIDLLDLRRAGPVVAVEALHDGEVLAEHRPHLADRLLMRATPTPAPRADRPRPGPPPQCRPPSRPAARG